MKSVPSIEMIKTVFKYLFGRTACKMYPMRPPVLFDATRGHIVFDPGACILCTLCAKKCPAGAIVVEREKATWEIDRGKCIVCGSCVENCPKRALAFQKKYLPPTTGETKEIFRVTPPEPKEEF